MTTARDSRFSSGKSIDQTRDTSSRDPKIEDLVSLLKFPDKKWVNLRVVGGVESYTNYWFPVTTKDGRLTSLPKPSLSWDPETETYDTTIQDPYKELLDAMQKRFPNADQKNQARSSTYYYVNVLVRDLQKNEPKNVMEWTDEEKKSYYKVIDSDSWTPYRVMRMPSGLKNKIRNLGKLNKHDVDGREQSMRISDAEYGVDISIYYDKDKSPSEQYQVNLGKHTLLTDAERDHLMFNLVGLQRRPELDTAIEDCKRLIKQTGMANDAESSSGDDYDDKPRKPAANQDRSFEEGFEDAPATKPAPAQSEVKKDVPEAPPARVAAAKSAVTASTDDDDDFKFD